MDELLLFRPSADEHILLQLSCQYCAAALRLQPDQHHEIDAYVPIRDPECGRCERITETEDSSNSHMCPGERFTAWCYHWNCRRCGHHSFHASSYPPDRCRVDPKMQITPVGEIPPAGGAEPEDWDDDLSEAEQELVRAAREYVAAFQYSGLPPTAFWGLRQDLIKQDLAGVLQGAAVCAGASHPVVTLGAEYARPVLKRLQRALDAAGIASFPRVQSGGGSKEQHGAFVAMTSDEKGEQLDEMAGAVVAELFPLDQEQATKDAAWQGVCPSCGSEEVVPVVFGMPSGEMFERSERGEAALGGCLVADSAKRRRCRACSTDF